MGLAGPEQNEGLYIVYMYIRNGSMDGTMVA